MKINFGELMEDLKAHGKKIIDPLLNDATLDNALDANGQNVENSGRIEVGKVDSGTTKPTTQGTFEIQIDTDTGSNGEAYVVWNDGGTKRTISIGQI